MQPTLKQRFGTLAFDRPFCAWPLCFPRLARKRGQSWVDFHNRGEKLVLSQDGPGFDCAWKWTSDLNVCRVFPAVGRRLLEAALAEWPIRLTGTDARRDELGPLVSFIIGHRGTEKISHLLATLRSILGQEGARVECLVVEQAWEPILPGRLPLSVRHVHNRPPAPDLPYARAWAFNVGARVARGDILVFHDNDILVPARYAAELVRMMNRGYAAARLKRFLFYLRPEDTAEFFDSGRVSGHWSPEIVRQNCEGGTLAVERVTYFALGGHDETFIGWGGEDNEMFDRCRTAAVYPYGYLPFVHLHHAPQPAEANTAHLEQRMSLAAAQRIKELSARPFGLPAGPNQERVCMDVLS